MATVAAAHERHDRLLAFLQMQRELLDEAAAGADSRSVIELLVDLIETQSPGAIASVLLVDLPTATLRTFVAPGLPDAFNDVVDGLPIGPDVGSCGAAAALKQTVVVEDIAVDARWEGYRELAAEHGLRACWSTPILDTAGEVLGTFALYSRTPRRPSERELEVVEVAAGFASLVFEREAAVARSEANASERRELERRYRTLVEQLPLVIYVDALDATSSNIFTSKQIEAMLGYSVDEWRDDPELFVKLLHPEDRERVLAAHEHTHATHEPLRLEYRLRARDGRTVWVRDDGVVVTGDDGTPQYLQGYLLDISPEREAEEQLRRQALYDPLTGVANRAHFNDRLDRAIAARREPGELTAILFADVNGFKGVNDRFGHHIGDAVLRGLADRLRAAVRPADTVARLGGDEFAVMIEHVTDAADVSMVAQRLHETLAEPLEIDGRRLVIETSIGISIGDDPPQLLKEADAAMYRAKSKPGAGFAFFDPTLDEAALIRFHRIDELAKALDAGQLRLHYQPIVSLTSGEVTGYEALIRWQHPELGLLPPSEFVPLAEATGLIVPIGRWVLRQACVDAIQMERVAGHPVEIAVNVAARQLQNAGFVAHVEEALEHSRLPHDRLVLEITESAVIDTSDVEHRLELLRAKGVKIALDDFGTGYGSLVYLQRLPIDIVKIDRSFTSTVDTDETNRALIDAIVSLGTALGTRLVAEGIERASQDAVVQALGCESGQGFHYGRPEPPRPA